MQQALSLTQCLTVFDLYGTDRLTAWREFRDSLENSSQPLVDVAEFWSRAPFVSSYLNPQTPADWPDPWHLILDGKLDQLAICLGIMYTLKLTQRFMVSKYEIHMSILPQNKDPFYYLVVDGQYVLNYEPRAVHDVGVLQEFQTNIVWSCDQLP